MSDPLPTYGFLPFLRQGLATRITGAAGARATISVELEVAPDAGAPQSLPPKVVALYGPGDVTGVERRAIARTEPLPGVANFEPNYLALVEFYDEDFPWRYTPLAPDAGRHLTPWLTLVVLKEGEFKEVQQGDAPLAAIEVTDSSLFPPQAELWAWAHVHTNVDIRPSSGLVDSSAAAVAEALGATTAANPDNACSRLIGPRRLQPNQGYHAFVVPTFESGRLAGLKLDPAKTPSAGHIAWDAVGYPDRANLSPTIYPYLHRWSFRTGEQGDFEYLVRLLQPRPVDPSVGVRDVDVQRPSVHVAGIADPPTLKFAGALRAPLPEAEVAAQDAWADPRPHPFQRTLADFVNLSDGYEAAVAVQANSSFADAARALALAHPEISAPQALDVIDDDEPDPVITPPLYGRWHAGTRRLLTLRNGSAAPNTGNWLHELNLDPRWRSAAGFGAQVVQSQQEALMASAWAQVGDLPDANRRIRGGQFALGVSATWHAATFKALSVSDPARSLLLTAPAHLRVMASGATVQARAAASRTPESLFSAPMRRAIRPGARLARKLGFTRANPPQRAIARVDAGDLPAVIPKTAPALPPKVDDTLDALPSPVPPVLAPLARWLVRVPLWLLLLLAFLLLLLTGLFGLAAVAVLVAGVVGAALWLRGRGIALAVVDGQREGQRTPGTVDRLPPAPGFQLIDGSTAVAAPATPAPGGGDSPDARRFKDALKDAYAEDVAVRAEGFLAPRPPLDLRATARVVTATLDPALSVPRRTMHDIAIPPRWRSNGAEQFDEIMNYPVFDTPMYRPLKELSADSLLPNMHLIPQNSITLLETNQRFIESYMVGLNHEFGRELLWREYPTDQRGSYFRQFWDVSGFFDPDSTDAESRREALRDIPPIHQWSPTSELGTHDSRESPGGPQRDDLVLTIRGDLMRKYPTANVYAHKAQWARTNGQIDRTRERLLTPLEASEVAKPPRSKVKTPLYKANASDDVFLYGFDLTAEEARGNPDSGDDPGWYFVIEERAGDPRFGLDIGSGAQAPQLWSDLSWSHFPAAVHLRIGGGIALTTQAPPDTGQAEDAARKTQWLEDRQVPWGPGSDAADVAYVLYQTPMRVAIHAAEMLAKPSPP